MRSIGRGSVIVIAFTMMLNVGMAIPVASGSTTGLPDGRTYELVSPPEKNGYAVLSANLRSGDFTQASADGNSVKYGSISAFQGSPSDPLLNNYLATRSSSSWTTTFLNPPTSQSPTAELSNYAVFALPTHLDQPLIRSTELLTPSTPYGVPNLFLRNTDGSYQLITTTAPPLSQIGNYELLPVAMSSDLKHVLFIDNAQLTPNAPAPNPQILYEAVEGHLSLVSVLPDGAGTVSPQSNFNDNPISPDGSRVFWQAQSDTQFVNAIYVRENGATTVPASASQRTNCADHNPCTGEPESDPNGPRNALLQWAAADGSRVLFTSPEELTNDAHTGGADNSEDLYAYDVATKKLTDLSVDINPADAGNGAGVQGVVGLSQDGSYVYFVADGQLVPGKGTDGQPNLYLWHAGVPLTYIATLSASDSGDWVAGSYTGGTGPTGAYVTPDGQHLVFLSVNSLTGYDNTDATTGQRDSEAFDYSAASGGVVSCASCNPSGARPTESATIGSLTLQGTSGYLPRAMSNDGSRLFFNSRDPLVPGSGNGHVKVFEYEGGRIYLISSGTSTTDALFGDASASGNDVFFTTESQLVPEDRDTVVDRYDARVGEGLPSLPAGAPSCAGDGCQAPPSGPPVFGSLSSMTYSGVEKPIPVSHLKPPVGSRARQLARALHACRADHKGRKRTVCEAGARRKYAVKARKTNRRVGR